MPVPGPSIPQPLFVTADTSTIKLLSTMAAAANVPYRHAADVTTAVRHLPRSTLVVIGDDLATEWAAARIPRRPNMILLAGDHLSYDNAWPLAITMGADHVAALPEASGWITERLTPRTENLSRNIAVAVTGARGGAGTSTFATAIAVAVTGNGLSATMIDADSHGGGIDLAIGWENVPGARWADIAHLEGPFDVNRWRDCLPTRDGLSVLSFGRDNAISINPITMESVIDVSCRASDVTIIDLPRHGEPSLYAVANDLDMLIIVLPAEVKAAVAARHVIARYANQCERAKVVVRLPSPGRLTSKAVAEAAGVPLAGEIQHDFRIAKAAERGRLLSQLGKSTMGKSAADIVDQLLPVRSSGEAEHAGSAT